MFKPVARTEIIVWLYSLKQARVLRRFGMVHYISTKMKYIVLYVNTEDSTQIVNQLNRHRYVRLAELSPRATLSFNIGDKLDQAAKSLQNPEVFLDHHENH